MSGDYALRDGKKPVVKVEPAEIRMNKVFTTKEKQSLRSKCLRSRRVPDREKKSE